MKKQMTDWFPKQVKPVRVGVYQVRADKQDKDKCFSYWDGTHWGYFCWSIEQAIQQGSEKSLIATQNKQWRGFTEKQE